MCSAAVEGDDQSVITSNRDEADDDQSGQFEGHAGGLPVAASVDAHFRYVAQIIWGRGEARQGCPLYPRKQTFCEAASMSAKCQKRTLAQTQQPDRQWEMSTAQKLLASLSWMS